jgi:hypothetical protein
MLQRVRDRYGEAVATIALYGTYKEQGLQGMRDLAARAQSEQTPYEVRLAAVANKRLPKHVQHADAQGQWQSFAATHVALSTLLFKAEADPGGTAPQVASATAGDEYLRQLERSASDAAVWRIVGDDPVALLLWSRYGAAIPWQFYHEQRDWLADILVQLSPLTLEDTESAQDTPPIDIADLVTTAQRYHPLVKQAVVDLELGVTGFSLFLPYGETIQVIVNKGFIPLEEVLAVLFANRDELASQQDMRDSQALAGYLMNIYRNKPTLWQYAMAHALALRLDREVPALAESLLREYGQYDIPAFLYTYFGDSPEALDQAARAVHYYGENALVILQRYAETGRLEPFLRNPKIGHRIVPFLAKEMDAGLDRAKDDPRWIDKYFNEEGRPVPAPWLMAVPVVGAPLQVTRNWFNGIPNEWGELGWAALDVADALLLIASLGTSSELTAMKAGAETVAKQAAKNTAKTVVKVEGEQAVKQLTKEGARRVVAEQTTRRVAKGGVQKVSQSLLRRAATTVHSGVIRVLGTSRNFIVWGSKPLLKAGGAAYQSARVVLGTWKGVSPFVRLGTYRMLLGASLLATLTARTIPGLHLIGTKLGELIGQLTRETVHAMTDGLTAAAQEAFRDMIPAKPSLLVPVAWVA